MKCGKLRIFLKTPRSPLSPSAHAAASHTPSELLALGDDRGAAYELVLDQDALTLNLYELYIEKK
jgi:hypothetical protein